MHEYLLSFESLLHPSLEYCDYYQQQNEQKQHTKVLMMMTMLWVTKRAATIIISIVNHSKNHTRADQQS
jgi:hypothetical protein